MLSSRDGAAGKALRNPSDTQVPVRAGETSCCFSPSVQMERPVWGCPALASCLNHLQLARPPVCPVRTRLHRAGTGRVTSQAGASWLPSLLAPWAQKLLPGGLCGGFCPLLCPVKHRCHLSALAAQRPRVSGQLPAHRLELVCRGGPSGVPLCSCLSVWTCRARGISTARVVR